MRLKLRLLLNPGSPLVKEKKKGYQLRVQIYVLIFNWIKSVNARRLLAEIKFDGSDLAVTCDSEALSEYVDCMTISDCAYII